MRDFFVEIGIDVTQEQLKQLEIFYNLLIEENEKYNLTAITDKTEVYVKHFIDSMMISKLNLPFEHKSFIDIGTGAGFPAIPLKIMYPSIEITGLDALNKRIGFIERACDAIQIDKIHLIHGRAEDFGQDIKYREKYDFAVSRAVAELRLLLEFVMPFVKVGGHFLAYKSLKTKTELEEANRSMKLMQSKLVDMVSFELPSNFGKREIMIIEKTGKIDKKYPRKPGIPKKSPL